MSKNITVVGMGAGDLGQLTIDSYRALKEAPRLFLRTERHPVVPDLVKEGVTYESFDAVYERYQDFPSVYQAIVEELLQRGLEEDLVYAVPGHPLVAEETVRQLLSLSKERGINVNIRGGQSFLDPMFAALSIDPIDGCQILDATMLKKDDLHLRQHMIICQVYDRFIASDIKITLMEKLPDDYEIVVVTAAGGNDEQQQKVPLYQLDHIAQISNLTSVYVPPVQEEDLTFHEFPKLREVIATLRGPDGCPWDKKQTHESLKKYLIEEAYEVWEAIDEQDDDHLAEELGDVLLQVMLHAQIAEDEGYFNVDDVIESVTSKMIRRHPHVFGNKKADSAEEVTENWEAIKKTEKGSKKQASQLDGAPKGLPGLYRALHYQKKAAKVGFDWKDPEPVWGKVREEMDEFQEALTKNNPREEIILEFGDLLFALVNLARFYNIDPEAAIQMTNRKFYNRFHYIEESLNQDEINWDETNLEEMDVLWEQAKQKKFNN